MDEKWTVGEFSRFYSRETVEIVSDVGGSHSSVCDVNVIDWAWTDDESERIPGPETMKRARAIAAIPWALTLLRVFVDGIDDEDHPMFREPLLTDAEIALMVEAECLLSEFEGTEPEPDEDVALTELAALPPVAALIEAAGALIPLGKEYLNQLRQIELEELGYCPACGEEDYCSNHSTQLKLLDALPAASFALAQFEPEPEREQERGE